MKNHLMVVFSTMCFSFQTGADLYISRNTCCVLPFLFCVPCTYLISFCHHLCLSVRIAFRFALNFFSSLHK